MLAGSDLEDEDWSGLEDFITMHVDSRLHFAHHLVRLTAYEGLPYRRRTELHARAAEILETALGRRTGPTPLLLSLHSLHGERYDAGVALLAAGRRPGPLAVRARPRRRVLPAGLERRAHRSDALTARRGRRRARGPGRRLRRSRRDAQAEEALRKARLRSRHDRHRLARLQLKTAKHRHNLGRHDDALRWVSRGRSTLKGSPEPDDGRLRAELSERGARIKVDQGAYRGALRLAARAIEEARSAGDRLVEARALGVYVSQAARAGITVTDEQVRTALELFEDAGDLREKARILNTLGVWAYFAGRWDVALGYYADSEDASRRIGRDYDAAAWPPTGPRS